MKRQGKASILGQSLFIQPSPPILQMDDPTHQPTNPTDNGRATGADPPIVALIVIGLLVSIQNCGENVRNIHSSHGFGQRRPAALIMEAISRGKSYALLFFNRQPLT